MKSKVLRHLRTMQMYATIGAIVYGAGGVWFAGWIARGYFSGQQKALGYVAVVGAFVTTVAFVEMIGYYKWYIKRLRA